MRAAGFVLAISLAVSSVARAQNEPGRWSYALGGLAIMDRAEYGKIDGSFGPILRADMRVWRSRVMSAGIDVRAAVLDRTLVGHPCETFGPGPNSTFCDDPLHVRWIGGAGAFVASAPLAALGLRWQLRAFADPVWGRIVEPGNSSDFAAWYGGVAVGVLAGRWRYDVEGGVAGIIHASHPRMWSFQVAYTP